MRQIDINEYKGVLVKILKEIDSFCKREGVVYYLDCGSLLGAVRHKGFIPWDDDIDLSMPRKDYEKFIKEFKSDNCTVLSFRSDTDYFYTFAKVNYNGSYVDEVELPKIKGLGINIDIFPLDGMPDNLLKRRIHQDILFLLNKVRAMNVRIHRKLPKPFNIVFQWRALVSISDKLGKRYSMDNTSYCGNLVATNIWHKEIPSSCFDGTDYLDFEDGRYPVPSGYDKYLKGLYGDYMKLPPKEKQITHHHIKAYLSK